MTISTLKQLNDRFIEELCARTDRYNSQSPLKKASNQKKLKRFINNKISRTAVNLMKLDQEARKRNRETF